MEKKEKSHGHGIAQSGAGLVKGHVKGKGKEDGMNIKKTPLEIIRLAKRTRGEGKEDQEKGKGKSPDKEAESMEPIQQAKRQLNRRILDDLIQKEKMKKLGEDPEEPYEQQLGEDLDKGPYEDEDQQE